MSNGHTAPEVAERPAARRETRVPEQPALLREFHGRPKEAFRYRRASYARSVPVRLL